MLSDYIWVEIVLFCFATHSSNSSIIASKLDTEREGKGRAKRVRDVHDNYVYN